MKTVKRNLWNLLFQSKKILFQEREWCRHGHILDVADCIVSSLEEAKDLKSLFFLHKVLWGTGVRNRNLSPSQDGFFRTKDIRTMKMEEVFLGNILGLYTYSIPEWEDMKESGRRIGQNAYNIDPGTLLYDIVVKQYRNILVSNVNDVKLNSQAFMNEYLQKQ